MLQRSASMLAVLWPASAWPASALAGRSGAFQAQAPLNNGFALAYFVAVLMLLALVYVVALAARGQSQPAVETRSAASVLVPILAVLGLGVAGYLTFVETQNAAPVCGPVGDCSSVQASPYARLFGFFPVGLLGLLGYLAILACWVVARWGRGQAAELARIAAFGMAVFGVLFSLYLTYLELFVIKAVCIWCLSSAVLITVLMVLALTPALAVMQAADEDEEDFSSA